MGFRHASPFETKIEKGSVDPMSVTHRVHGLSRVVEPAVGAGSGARKLVAGADRLALGGGLRGGGVGQFCHRPGRRLGRNGLRTGRLGQRGDDDAADAQVGQSALGEELDAAAQLGRAEQAEGRLLEAVERRYGHDGELGPDGQELCRDQAGEVDLEAVVLGGFVRVGDARGGAEGDALHVDVGDLERLGDHGALCLGDLVAGLGRDDVFGEHRDAFVGLGDGDGAVGRRQDDDGVLDAHLAALALHALGENFEVILDGDQVVGGEVHAVVGVVVIARTVGGVVVSAVVGMAMGTVRVLHGIPPVSSQINPH